MVSLPWGIYKYHLQLKGSPKGEKEKVLPSLELITSVLMVLQLLPFFSSANVWQQLACFFGPC